VGAHHDQVNRHTGGAFENTASRLTPIDQDIQADACCRRRFTMGRGSGGEICRCGVVGRFAGARHFEAGI